MSVTLTLVAEEKSVLYAKILDYLSQFPNGDLGKDLPSKIQAKYVYVVYGLNPSAWGHLNPSSYCDVGRLFYGVFKLWSKLQRKK